MRRALLVVALSLACLATARADDELDPASMTKGESGTLPQGKQTMYRVLSVYDDDVLIAQLQAPAGGVFKVVATFFFRDAEAVTKYGKLPQPKGDKALDAPIELPGTYTVIGTKTKGDGVSVPRIKKK